MHSRKKASRRAPVAATAPASRRPGSTSWLLRFGWLIPVALAGLVHLGVLQNGFAYDDVKAIELLSKGQISLSGSFVAVPNAAEVPRDRSRRVTYALHALDYRLWGTRPFGFHLTNLALHMLASGLVFAAALLFTRTPQGAMLAALLFAVHPVHVEAIASFANRKDILALIFDLAALLCWVKIRRWSVKLLAVAALIALGLMAMEAAVLGLPVILMAAHNVLGRGEDAEPTNGQIRALGILVAVFAATVVVGLMSGGRLSLFAPAHIAAATEDQLSDYGQVLANSAIGVLHLLRLLVFPVLLSADYPLATQATWTTPAVVLGLLALGALVAFPLSLYRRHPRVALAAGWLVITYLPLSNLVPISHIFIAERYLYVPSFGFCVLCGMGVESLASRSAARAQVRFAIGGAVALVLVLLSVRSVQRVRDWRDEVSLWSSASRSGLETYRIRYKLGVAMLKSDPAKADAAAAELSRAIAMRPGLPEQHMWLAAARFAGNHFDDAWREANAALREDSTDSVSHFIRGEILLQREDVVPALADYRAAVAADSTHPGATLRIAMIDLQLAKGRPDLLDEAVIMAGRAVRRTASEDPVMHRQALEVLVQAEAAARAIGR